MKHTPLFLRSLPFATAALIAATATAADDHLRLGYAPGGSATLTVIARAEGFFEQVGLKGTEFIYFKGTPDGLGALNAGKIDVGVSYGTGAPLTWASKGSPFVIVGGSQLGGHPIITRPENADKFKTIEDFKGHKVGSPRIYTSDVVFRGALIKAGIDAEKDLEIVPFKYPVDVLEAVKSGKIEAGVGNSSVRGRAIESGLAIPLHTPELLPDHPCCRVVTTEKSLASKRPLLVKYLEGIILAEKFWNENREKAIEDVSKILELPLSVAREQTDFPYIGFPSNPNRKGVTDMYNYMKEVGYIEGEVDLSKAIDVSLYREALSELEAKYPGDEFLATLEARFAEQDAI